jgi:hypothetical protein
MFRRSQPYAFSRLAALWRALLFPKAPTDA